MKIKKSLAINRLPFIVIVLYIFNVFNPDMHPQTTLLSNDLELELRNQSGGSLSKQIFWVTSLLVTILLCHLEKVRLIYNPKVFNALIFVLAVTFISVAWSDSPFISIKRSIFQVVFFFTLYFASLLLRTRENLFETLYIALCIILIFEIVFLIFMSGSSFANTGEFKGFHTTKNGLGVVAFLGVIVSLEHHYKQKRLKTISNFKSPLLVAISWTGILLLSQSKTCLLMTAVCSFSYVSHSYATSLFAMTRSTAKSINLFLLVLFCLSILIFNDFISIYDNIFSIVDLTGRGVIWSISLESIAMSPYLGSGYGAFWGTGEVPELFDVEFSFLAYLNQAHNGYIDLCLQLGVPGLMIFMYLIYRIAASLKTAIGSKYLMWCLFLFVLVHNITESSFLRDTAFSWFILILVMLAINLGASDKQTSKKYDY